MISKIKEKRERLGEKAEACHKQLISGTILSSMVSSWESAKYLFMVNLELASYLNGSAPPIEGMTLGFSLTVLMVWGLVALAIAFIRFTKQDVY